MQECTEPVNANEEPATKTTAPVPRGGGLIVGEGRQFKFAKRVMSKGIDKVKKANSRLPADGISYVTLWSCGPKDRHRKIYCAHSRDLEVRALISVLLQEACIGHIHLE